MIAPTQPAESAGKAENTFAIAARNKKAAALVAVLQTAGVSLSVAELADANDWALAAQAAHVKPPSAKTIALVLRIMDAAENPEPECNCRQIDVDEFDNRECPAHGQPAATMGYEATEEIECPF